MALAVASDPDSSAQDLLRVVQQDPPLAAKLVRTANSVFFNRGYQITDLQAAVVRLGFSNVRNLLLGVSVIRSFDAFFAGAPYTREDFWVHSISVGSLAGRLTGAGKVLSSSTAFLCGLLHDIGKLLLDRFLRSDFTQALKIAEECQMPLHEVEERSLGVNHAIIGAGLLEVWKFPEELIEPVRWHHDPESCPESHRAHAQLVQVADYLCITKKLGYSGNPHPASPAPHVMARYGLTEETLEFLFQSLEKDPLADILLPA
jgi:putative nucleotidyltransferase with HDIG domain